MDMDGREGSNVEEEESDCDQLSSPSSGDGGSSSGSGDGHIANEDVEEESSFSDDLSSGSSGSDSLSIDKDDSYEVYFDDMYRNLDEDDIADIEQDEYLFDSLSIGWTAERDAWEGEAYDWERIGNAIGGNTSMWRLRIIHFHGGFCRGVAQNRSLAHLEIKQVNFASSRGDNMFAILLPFFELNANLRRLEIRSCYDRFEAGSLGDENIRSLAMALSNCYPYSLRRIDLDCNGLSDDDAAQLIGAMAGHRRLKYLRLDSNELAGKSCAALSSLLNSPKTKLKELHLGNNEIDDESLTILSNALRTNDTVKFICLGGAGDAHRRGRTRRNPITSLGFHAFASQLGSPSNSLEKLDISHTNLDDESARDIGNALCGRSTMLRSLNIGACERIGAAGWQAIARGIRNSRPGLEVLNISRSQIDDASAIALANGLIAHNETLEELDVSYNESISSAGWQSVFPVFPPANSVLERLNISRNRVDRVGFDMLVDALASAGRIKELRIKGNTSIGAGGWNALSGLLRRPTCVLKALYFSFGERVNDEMLIGLVNALASNATLQKLYFNAAGGSTTRRGWSTFDNLVCDTSSIDATYQSNHCLQSLEGTPRTTRHLLDSLAINKAFGKEGAARRKILKHHFPDGHSNIHLFSDMEWNALPHALAWTGKDCQPWSLSLLFRLVRSMPSLVEATAGARASRMFMQY